MTTSEYFEKAETVLQQAEAVAPTNPAEASALVGVAFVYAQLASLSVGMVRP